MNKTLLITLVIGATLLGGFLYHESKAHKKSFLSNLNLQYVQYQNFMKTYGKTYGTDEIHYRFMNYQANLQIINDHNAKYNAGTESYFLGENEFADLSLAEFTSKMLGYKKPEKKSAPVAAFTAYDLDVSALNATVDWVANGAVTPVKNQGQCGSCWAFSSTGALEGLHQIASGKLWSFSEQQLVDCSASFGNNGCNGGLMDNAFNYTAANGIANESAYNYTAADGTCHYNKSTMNAFQNKGYADVTVNSESAMIAALAVQPVAVAIEADQSSFQLYAGGILNATDCGTNLDHGVLAVGYGSNYYKVKNSWGASWGEQGYIRLARTGDGAGMCGIQMSASYPTN